MKPDIILIGGGGHCKSCIDVIEQENKYQIAGIVDLPEKLKDSVFGYNIIGSDDDLPELIESYKNILITKGQINFSNQRIELFEYLRTIGAEFPIIQSPLAYISPHAKVGKGTIVMHHAVINAGAEVGINCIINTKSLIEHDVIIGDHCHIATGAIINGNVEVGEGTFVGSRTVTKQGIRIGKKCVIGAGTVLRDSVSANQTVIP